MANLELDTIHERISLLVDYFCSGNKTAFGRETDILPGVLASITGGRLSKPSFELLQKIMTRYPSVSGDWLILGRGPMIVTKAVDNGTIADSTDDSGRENYIALRNLRQQYKNVHEDLYRWGRVGELVRRVYSIVSQSSFTDKEQDELVAGMETASKEEVVELYKTYRNDFRKQLLKALKAPIDFAREEQSRVYSDTMEYGRQHADIVSKIKLLPESE
jgi:hypothetical protein